MKNIKWAFALSLFILIGFPLFFLFISLLTGQWKYLIFSIAPSFVAGFTGLMVTVQQIKKERRK